MRAKEFLLEAQNYEAMFDGLRKIGQEMGNDDDIRAMTNPNISWAKRTLQKNDRIVWFLRYVKLSIIDLMINKAQLQASGPTAADAAKKSEQIKPILDALQKESQKTRKKMKPNAAVPQINFLRSQLEHSLSLPIPKIQQHTFGNETFQELVNVFNDYENEWKEEREGTLEPQEGDKPIIKFNENLAWWHLPRGGCSDEANAMGHCGNVGWRDYDGTTILSLRTKLPNGLYRPHLTFIIDKNGYLGEMKGRANEKPKPKYHPYIIKLLEHEMVKGIKGGGYAPENNFSLSDLDEETREKLIDKKPSLGTVKDLAKKFGKDSDEVTKAISAKLEALEDNGVRYFGYDEKNKVHQLDHWKDIEQFCETTNGNMDHYIKYFNGNDTLDMWGSDTSYHLEDFFNGMNDKLKGEVKEVIQHIAKTDPDRIQVSPEDVYDFYEFINENELDEIKTAAEYAILRGIEAGAEQEMWEAFKSTTENLQNGLRLMSDETGGEWRFGEPISLVADNSIMIDLLSDEGFMDEVEYEGGWLTSEVNVEEPYYGWSGYDEDAAYEDFSDMRLYDLQQELGMK